MGNIEKEIIITPKVETYQVDDRLSFEKLRSSYFRLKDEFGWNYQLIGYQVEKLPNGLKFAFPILSFRTKEKGPADWVIFGIHGTEPAGPMMIAKPENIELLAIAGKEKPLVLLGPLNPGGYLLNRYRSSHLDENGEPTSVTDCDYFLGRAKKTACPEAAAIVPFVTKLSKDYPPHCVLDLHEDSPDPKEDTKIHPDSHGTYIYVHGTKGPKDSLAQKIVTILRENEIPLIEKGHTRFGEPIIDGMVINAEDGSIDEYLVKKCGAQQVIVLETPANISLSQRVAVHQKTLELILGPETFRE